MRFWEMWICNARCQQAEVKHSRHARASEGYFITRICNAGVGRCAFAMHEATSKNKAIHARCKRTPLNEARHARHARASKGYFITRMANVGDRSGSPEPPKNLATCYLLPATKKSQQSGIGPEALKSSSGLSMGMPKLSPRRMKINPSKPKNTG